MDEVEMDEVEYAGAHLPQNESESETENPSDENVTPPDTNNASQVDLATLIKLGSNHLISAPLSLWGGLIGLGGCYNVDFDNEHYPEIERDPSEYRLLIYTHAPLFVLSTINTCCCLKVKSRWYKKVYENMIEMGTYGIILQQLIIGYDTASSEYSWEQNSSNMLLGMSSVALCIKGGWDLYRYWRFMQKSPMSAYMSIDV